MADKLIVKVIAMASEVRLCPDCELAATRRPELDTATELAWRCPSHWHRTVLEAAPAGTATAAVVQHVAVTDAVVATPEAAEPDDSAADEAQDARDAEDAEDRRTIRKTAAKSPKKG